jgi:hypothetical protein
MANPVQHEDFGEKIGGAKKDLWIKRGLLSDDLAGMNGREADQYVKKDNVWKKPDYQAMIDGGLPVGVTYFIKTVRDSLDTAPAYLRGDDAPESRLARQKQYIDTVREVQAVVEGVKVESDIYTAFARCMVNNGYFERVDGGISGPRFNLTDKGRQNPVITNKLANALHITSESAYTRKILREAEKKQFGVPKDDKIPTGYEIRFNDGKNSFSADDSWKPGTWFVAKSYRILQTNFESREAAVKWAQDFARQRGADGKAKFVPPQLAHVKREGPDYRRGRNADGQDYLAAFGFKGGEFGNWMSQADRQGSLNMGYDALKDLAAALKISGRDISYQGELSIAFGARGSGNAVAHYEPLRQVINLTKMRGAGSLAHEWWHGLDDFLGKKLDAGGMLSENPRKHPLMAKLIDTIKYKPETPEQAAARAGNADARTVKNAKGWLESAVLASVNRTGDEKVTAEYEGLRDAYLRGETGSVDKLNDLKKSLTGRVIPKEDRDRLHSFERILHGMAEGVEKEPSIGKVPTDYYRGSKEMGTVCMKDGGYWDSNTELTARAFATYIMDRLPGRSDYLAGHAECAIAMTADREGNPKIVKAYPEGSEREAINAVFDDIVAELKREHHLTHDEHAQPEQPPGRWEPEAPRAMPEFRRGEPAEQLSLFGPEKPSAMERLAAAKEAVAQNGAGKAAPEKAKDKSHGAEL